MGWMDVWMVWDGMGRRKGKKANRDTIRSRQLTLAGRKSHSTRGASKLAHLLDAERPYDVFSQWYETQMTNRVVATRLQI